MNVTLPPLYALRAFEVAARHGSFTRAAEELSITQSAVSRHIKTLENSFGCHLFVRHGPRLSLTDQGRILAQELKAGFKLIESACQLLKDNRYGIRLKAPSTLTIRWLLSRLNAFNAQSPHPVHLSSVWMDVDTVDFYAEPYDCAILLGPGAYGGEVDKLKLFDEWLVPICAPSYLPPARATLDQLDRCDILHPSPDRRDWKRWLARQRLRERVDIDRGLLFDTLDQGISASVQGLGVSVCDLILSLEEIAAGRLAIPFPTAVGTGDGYYLIWLRNNPKAPRIRAFGEFLQARVATLPQGLDYLA